LFLDGNRESEDVNDVVDLLALDKSSEFSDWLPFSLFSFSFRSLSTFLVLAVSSSSKTSSIIGLGGFCLGNLRSLYFSHKILYKLKWLGNNKKIIFKLRWLSNPLPSTVARPFSQLQLS
jgi:hypothetical protein